MNYADTEKLAAELKKYRSKKKTDDYGWNNTALNVIDCILSLNRKYFAFCKPRVEEFRRNHPDVRTVLQLQKMLNLDTPDLFLKKELRYSHVKRAEMLYGLVNCLSDFFRESSKKVSPDIDDRSFFKDWAEKTDYSDYKNYKISGFGIAGFQYLRMLFGANTTKPDIHIVRFVSGVLKRNVSQEETVVLMEQAARIAGVHLRTADGEIWNSLADK
ncbi:MAG TPA: hypothetical protein PK453_13485 [Leptospiraceae bacterium]|nr:hypothetical protein [Leptospiraceae bacterium]HMY68124.1 hypothetical protein [Leptospiraceae bacterium]HNF14677.1 hypothetical protein [Leptospiraceae bacterium]HNF24772.1 hypothetical protein [Leptospiraceae bacterium]HNM02402.1 hypothetical protein [Leptospiraceae bacterium]